VFEEGVFFFQQRAGPPFFYPAKVINPLGLLRRVGSRPYFPFVNFFPYPFFSSPRPQVRRFQFFFHDHINSPLSFPFPPGGFKFFFFLREFFRTSVSPFFSPPSSNPFPFFPSFPRQIYFLAPPKTPKGTPLFFSFFPPTLFPLLWFFLFPPTSPPRFSPPWLASPTRRQSILGTAAWRLWYGFRLVLFPPSSGYIILDCTTFSRTIWGGF